MDKLINGFILFICIVTIFFALFTILNTQTKLNEHDKFFITYIKSNCPIAYLGLQQYAPSYINLSAMNIT